MFSEVSYEKVIAVLFGRVSCRQTIQSVFHRRHTDNQMDNARAALKIILLHAIQVVAFVFILVH